MRHAPVSQIVMCGLGIMCIWPFIVRELRTRWKRD